jgi:hypothetical protein
MKKIIALFACTLILISSIMAQKSDKKILRHVVMFGWEKGTDANEINNIVTAFKMLPSQISLIKAFEFGTNNSPENLNKGLTHCFTLTFSSEADRDAYLVHPAHKAFVAKLKPSPTAITVFDYWAE